MAAQRITIVKVGGVAADAVSQRLQIWRATRRSTDMNEYSNEQWPEIVRRQVDDFAEQLRARATLPPVVHFIEWIDLWSMGDLFTRWLAPPGCEPPLAIYADRFEIFAYELPDQGGLSDFLSSAGSQQWPESELFVTRLREAVEAWRVPVERAVIVVLREVVGGLVTDEAISDSLRITPDWLA